ncbi:hypothetical protein ACUIAK_21645 [Bacillus cytotoxicus]
MKEFQFGNTKVIIHSPLASMGKEEQKRMVSTRMGKEKSDFKVYS